MTALAVASLAAVSVGAMVVSSELLVDTVDRPARRRLDPLVLDLGPVGTVQAELPRDARGPQPPRRRPPAAAPPPQRQPAGPPPAEREPAGPPPAERDDDDGVTLVAQRTVVRKVVVVVRRPALRPAPRPSPPVSAPPEPPERRSPARQWRRWAPTASCRLSR